MQFVVVKILYTGILEFSAIDRKISNLYFRILDWLEKIKAKISKVQYKQIKNKKS
jgi:hypothetical protein